MNREKEFNRLAESSFNYKVEMKQSKRIITPKGKNIIAKRLDVIEKKSKIIIVGKQDAVYAFGKAVVTHIGPDVSENIKVGDVVFMMPGMAIPLNPIEGNEDSQTMIIFTESAISYSVTE